MKHKVIVLLFAWAFFYGIALAGAIAHRSEIKIALPDAANELSQMKVENR